jgi:hypothetical protein
MPVILIYGDSDMIRRSTCEVLPAARRRLKDAAGSATHANRLAILPNLTHYELGIAPELVGAALPFLNGAGRAKSWSVQVGAK